MKFGTVLLMMSLVVAPAFAQEAGTISGVTEPIQNVVIKAWGKKVPPWSGRISRVLVKEGQQVDANQPLIEMDRRDEEVEVRLRTLLAQDDAELKTVKERERLLKQLWLVNKSVNEDNRSVSKEEVTKRELEYRLAVAERQRIEDNLERAKIELEGAQIGLENRVIRSPIRGTVVKIHLHEGESAEANDPLIQVVDTSRCRFICNVEEKVGRNLAEGQQVNLRIQTGSTQELKTGTIVYVSPVVESASFLLTVKVEFGNTDGKIRPGVPGVMQLPNGQ